MRKHLRYANYLIRHKYFVFLAGRRTKASLWRLIVHDWSKLTPTEWFPYVEKFYGEGGNQAGFDRAWLHHQHHNPHHWQHWVLKEDGGMTKLIPMPTVLVREMVADWMGAGRAITGRWEVAGWYAKNQSKILLHPGTRVLVDEIIEDVS